MVRISTLFAFWCVLSSPAMSSLGKRKKAPKPSGSVSISRPHVEETQRPVPPLARSQTFYRQGTGKLGSTTSYVNGPASTSVHEDVLGPWDPHFFDEPPPDPEPDPLPAQSQPVPVSKPVFSTPDDNLI